jgi:hypothetical protein
LLFDVFLRSIKEASKESKEASIVFFGGLFYRLLSLLRLNDDLLLFWFNYLFLIFDNLLILLVSDLILRHAHCVKHAARVVDCAVKEADLPLKDWSLGFLFNWLLFDRILFFSWNHFLFE